MIQDMLSIFLEKVKTNKNLRQAVSKAETVQEVIDIANKNNLDITTQELKELANDELEACRGGGDINVKYGGDSRCTIAGNWNSFNSVGQLRIGYNSIKLNNSGDQKTVSITLSTEF